MFSSDHYSERAVGCLPALPTLYPSKLGFSDLLRIDGQATEGNYGSARIARYDQPLSPTGVFDFGSMSLSMRESRALPVLADALRDFDKELDELLIGTCMDDSFDHGTLLPRLPAVPFESSFTVDTLDLLDHERSVFTGGDMIDSDLRPLLSLTEDHKGVAPLWRMRQSGSGCEERNSSPTTSTTSPLLATSLYALTPPPSAYRTHSMDDFCASFESPCPERTDKKDSLPSAPRPKRPLNAFILWSCEERRTGEYSGTPANYCSSALRDKWSKLPDSGKRVWQEKSRALFNEFKAKYPHLSYHPAKGPTRKDKKAAKAGKQVSSPQRRFNGSELRFNSEQRV